MEIPEQCCSKFHESLWRTFLLLGCEPTLLVLAALIWVLIGFSVWPHYLLCILSFAGFVATREVLRAQASEDPIFLRVWWKAWNKGYGKARSAKNQYAVRWRIDAR